MARSSFRSVGSQTSESGGQIQGVMNRERALRRLVLKHKGGPIKTFTDSDVRSRFQISNMPAKVPVDKLPIVKLKEGGFSQTKDAKQWKYHSMAEYNAMRRNTKNYCHYRSYIEPSDPTKEELPVLRDQATNTESLMLRPYISSPAPRPKTAALVGVPPAQSDRVPRTARSANLVVRKEKVNNLQTPRTEPKSEQTMNTYRLQGNGYRRRDETPSEHDPDQQKVEPEEYQQLTSQDKTPKVTQRTGVQANLAQGQSRFNTRFLKFYSGSDMGASRSTEHLGTSNLVQLGMAQRNRRSSVEGAGRRVTFREDQNQNIYFGNKGTKGYVIEPLEDLKTGTTMGPFALTEKNLVAFNKIQMKLTNEELDLDEESYTYIGTTKRVSEWVKERRVQIPIDIGGQSLAVKNDVNISDITE